MSSEPSLSQEDLHRLRWMGFIALAGSGLLVCASIALIVIMTISRMVPNWSPTHISDWEGIVLTLLAYSAIFALWALVNLYAATTFKPIRFVDAPMPDRGPRAPDSIWSDGDVLVRHGVNNAFVPGLYGMVMIRRGVLCLWAPTVGGHLTYTILDSADPSMFRLADDREIRKILGWMFNTKLLTPLGGAKVHPDDLAFFHAHIAPQLNEELERYHAPEKLEDWFRELLKGRTITTN
ncbi:hypothetical protein HGA91_04030 [candidate division WWE3 bacterium]|nr:hypothetical protein [candidate division WWE3 bacterium]